MNKMEAELRQASEGLRVPLFDVANRSIATLQQLKDVERRGKKVKSALEDDAIIEVMRDAAIDVGYPLVVIRRDGLDTSGLRGYWDTVRDRMGAPGALVVGTVNEGKPVIMAAGTKEAVEKGFDAGKVIKAIAKHIQGGGGGKPVMAQAGGKNADGIDAALDAARELLGAN
jgi:alanyl-tRNA synthetase